MSSFNFPSLSITSIVSVWETQEFNVSAVDVADDITFVLNANDLFHVVEQTTARGITIDQHLLILYGRRAHETFELELSAVLQ